LESIASALSIVLTPRDRCRFFNICDGRSDALRRSRSTWRTPQQRRFDDQALTKIGTKLGKDLLPYVIQALETALNMHQTDLPYVYMGDRILTKQLFAIRTEVFTSTSIKAQLGCFDFFVPSPLLFYRFQPPARQVRLLLQRDVRRKHGRRHGGWCSGKIPRKA
jgi:hypothetical protein